MAATATIVADRQRRGGRAVGRRLETTFCAAARATIGSTAAPANDRLVGGGGDDVFLFASGDGADRLIGYETGEDFIVLSVDGVDSFDDLAITDFARGALVDLGGGDQLRLIGVDADDLSATDFAFV